MMTHIQGTFTTLDRWPMVIDKLGPGESRAFDRTDGTYYVLLQDSSFYSDNANFDSVNAAFAVNSHFTVKTGHGNAAIVEHPGLHLLESRYYVQNKLEMGNLSYIDGGTNTTAVNPGRLGDPVVNYVHFPAGMRQTLHTHPSHRVGIVLKGRGLVELDHSEFALKTGDVFFLQRNVLHNFTCPYNEDVVLYVFAPDSGTGPTDEVNPLKIRTYIGQQRYAR